jgi:Ca2+-binding EF-hand superfamily protein
MSGGYPNEIVLLDEDSPSAPGETNQDRRPSCEEVMAEFDADGDGELSETEREAMEAARDARELEEFDANGDGVLSDDERPVRPERSDRRGPFAQGDEEPSFDSLNMSGGYPNEIVLFDEDSPSAPSETDLDRRPSREEVMAEFDVDGDGELSESEMEAMEAARDARELVEFDANGDGVISDDERPQRPDRGRVNGVGGPDGNGPSREEMLAEFDADGDGELSESEREAMKAARDARELEEFDANGDGVLSDDERPERPDPALKNSRGAMRDAHRNLMEAMKSGDSSAIALAQQALRDARGEFGVITQTYFNQ